MQFEYTDGCNKDFVELCHGLDDFLNELVGGEENRAAYVVLLDADKIAVVKTSSGNFIIKQVVDIRTL